MKALKQCSILLVALMCLLLPAACANSPMPLTETATAPAPTVTAMPSSTLTPTRTPRTMGPTSTHFPTATPPPVLPTPLTPVPTLTSEEERAYVEKMLETNAGCELPCWWGIATGQATLQTLKNFKAFYSKPYPQRDGTVLYSSGHFEVTTFDGKPDYYVDVGLADLNGTVLAIETVSGVSVRNPNGNFAQAWKRYSVDQILSRYGVPSAVRIQLAPPSEPGASLGYALTLVYEKLGFLISYSGTATYGSKDDLLSACPSLENVERIGLRFQSLSAPTRFPLLRPMDPPGYDRSLQEATGMSLDDFYNKFKDPSSQDCLEGTPTLP